MKRHLRHSLSTFSLILFIFLIGVDAIAQDTFVYGDPMPDAPELSARGPHAVGVRTLDFIHKDQVDILNSKDGNEERYDRPLKVEVWYPAVASDNANPFETYNEVMGTRGDSLRPLIPFTFKGRALRDANPKTAVEKFPLVVVSHGYVGSRYLMTYLTENLASKGYVVVAIDHTDSTFKDANAFYSTLLNRAKDISFMIDAMQEIGKDDSGNVLAGIVDASNTAIIGYSMGGYGVLNVGGAGYSTGLGQFFGSMTGGSTAIRTLLAGNENYEGGKDARIKAIVAFAPWGMERGIWDSEGLKGLKTPTFFVAGNQDDISGYQKGIKAIFDGAKNADRYMLTYLNARHNVAPNPPPVASLQPGRHIDEYYRYAEPSWDQRKLNNINQHFVTAFLGTHLKGEDFSKYLNLPQDSNENTWEGFKPRSSTGMELRYEEGM